VLRPVGRSLDRRAPVARADHLPEEPLEVDRLGRREGRGSLLAADDPAHGAHEPGHAPRVFEHGVEQERRRRLAVRPRDACDLELARRLAEEGVRGDGHRCACVRDDELGHDDVELALDDERDRALLERLPREVVPVDRAASNAEEERACLDGARVVREVGDLRRSGSGHLAGRERPDESLELHLRRG
jgi:hypothetical protein